MAEAQQGALGNVRQARRGGTEISRLMLLVPYLKTHVGATRGELAAEFDTTEEQIQQDLNTLWVCGLPGHGPGDLIDLAFEGDTVTVTFDAGIDRPLQLTGEEATALVVALRALADTPDLASNEAVTGALAKIESAVGDRASESSAISVTAEPPPAVAADITDALRRGRAMEIDYYVATRDETTTRLIDPLRQFRVDGRHYVEAWCRTAESVRMFRLDRIDSARILEEPAQGHDSAPSRDLSAGVFQATSDHPRVELNLTRGGRWVADYYPVEDLSEETAGVLKVFLRISDEVTLQRLIAQLGPDGLSSVDDPAVGAAIEAISARSREALLVYGIGDSTDRDGT